MSDDIIIRGVAHRGDCDPEIAKYVAGATVAKQPLPVFPQFNQHVVIGDAIVDRLEETGDIFVRATIAGSKTAWLINNPFLALTISTPGASAIGVPEDGPHEIVQVAVTDTVLDPLQLPYRIVEFSTCTELEFAHKYERVVEIDEAYVAAINLNDDGSLTPIFDQEKSHIELRHRTERQRLAVPDAVARGNGYDSWAQAVSLDEAAEMVNVVRHVMGVL